VELELASVAMISSVAVRNTHHGRADDICTADFVVDFSNELDPAKRADDPAAWVEPHSARLKNRLGGRRRAEALAAALAEAGAADEVDDELVDKLEGELAAAEAQLQSEVDVTVERFPVALRRGRGLRAARSLPRRATPAVCCAKHLAASGSRRATATSASPHSAGIARRRRGRASRRCRTPAPCAPAWPTSGSTASRPTACPSRGPRPRWRRLRGCGRRWSRFSAG
jgi:hypothetical protein